MRKTSRREFQASKQLADDLFFRTVATGRAFGARVYQIHLDHPDGRDTSTLNEAELARGARMRSPTLQQRALAGRVALRAILAVETGTAPAEFVIATQPAGKPVLAGRTLHFSLAHTGAYAAVAVSDQAPVGIDLECFNRDADFQGIATKFFHATEARWLGNDPRVNFFRLWTSKEAILKCTGEGIAHHLAELRTRELTPAHAQVEYAGQLWQVEFQETPPSLIIALVTERADREHVVSGE